MEEIEAAHGPQREIPRHAGVESGIDRATDLSAKSDLNKGQYDQRDRGPTYRLQLSVPSVLPKASTVTNNNICTMKSATII